VSTTPFDFPTCDFLRESLPAFQFAAAARDNGFVPEYSLYESPVNKMESIIDDSVCIVCLEQPAGVRLMVCSYCHFPFPSLACLCKMSKIDQCAPKVRTTDLVCCLSVGTLPIAQSRVILGQGLDFVMPYLGCILVVSSET
jgi:hypothetical protein